MRFSNVALVAHTHVDAPEVVTSAALAEQLSPTLRALGIGPGILEMLTGIRERRFLARGAMPSSIATEAATRLLAGSGIARQRIGLLVSTSVCRDYIEPSMASTIHGRLGLAPECMNFDIANACLGFLDGLAIAGRMIERGEIEFAMVVDGEDSRRVTEATVARLNANPDREAFKQSLATLTLGSGAAAMLIGRASDFPAAPRLTGMLTRAATQHNNLCRGQPDEMITDSAGLLVAGVELGHTTFQAASAEFGWSAETIDQVVLHQVSGTHTDRVLDTLGIARDRALRIYPEYGNVGPAAVPIAFSLGVAQGRLHTSQRIALMGIGSGLNCTMAEVCW
jgi:3-oxoacyl-[acyl-carrier-protein] synthase III